MCVLNTLKYTLKIIKIVNFIHILVELIMMINGIEEVQIRGACFGALEITPEREPATHTRAHLYTHTCTCMHTHTHSPAQPSSVS